MYDETFQEVYLASRLNTMYLTQSTLKAQLLSKEMGKQSVDSQIANMALRLDVPVLENSKITDIISIRNDYGESFANFRTELGEKLLHLLHDIGRKFGVRHLGHVYDGYVYMKSLGYDEVAKICLTHSFNNHTIDEYIGKFDVTDEELTIIKTELAKTIYDEYDRLIQLCDCLAGA